LRFALPIAALALTALFSCKQDTPNATEAAPGPDTIRLQPVSTEGARTFAVTGGQVHWSAKKAVGAAHTGTVEVDSGSLLVNQGQLLSGHVVLDMQSIAVNNMKDNGERRELESHLRDRDFFNVAEFPRAEFTFDEVLPSNLPAFNWVLSGRLTIKGHSHPVNIPVQVTLSGDELRAESPTFQINRMDWGINFRSGALGTAKDKLIEDVIPMQLKITAKAK
jgi:polyisoprenoid-binding protein YceI